MPEPRSSDPNYLKLIQSKVYLFRYKGIGVLRKMPASGLEPQVLICTT